MNGRPNYGNYATKMKHHVLSGTDLEVDVRFVDMLSRRSARILDIGCGIGSAVNGLRSSGHEAFGVDPTPEVLIVAEELYESSWFRNMAASDISPATLALAGLPETYDLILMSGNVPSFFSDDELAETFLQVEKLLKPSGIFVIGTTTAIQGGPVHQSRAAAATKLALTHRYADWHLSPFTSDSPWSVSVYSAAGSRDFSGGPDGMFILRGGQ